MEKAERIHEAIAIDGPAASGKSTVARRVAQRLGYTYVNSGAMYRAVTWILLRQGVPVASRESVVNALGSLEIECGAEGGASTIRINGEDPGPHLKSEEVNRSVSALSAIPEVRQVLVEKLVAYRDLVNVVMEGRDIGSVVFPDSPFKFYVDASQEVRDARRRKQGLRDEISERDRRDSSRETSPLIVPRDAHVIDSSAKTIDEVVDEILDVLRSRGLAPRS